MGTRRTSSPTSQAGTAVAVGDGVVGAGVDGLLLVGAGVVGVVVVGVGVVGAEVVGAGLVGAEVVGAGLVGGEVVDVGTLGSGAGDVVHAATRLTRASATAARARVRVFRGREAARTAHLLTPPR
ncbi:hypothetical protein [Longivirga aurantiaca]|uniref:Uncharacterized protein n=1 Tax=Longivirga aurantiaca TaxID=1837743 RepID=A0ABW1SZT7_9ACTN